MRTVTRPTEDAGETFATCISSVHDSALKTRLQEIRPDIEDAAVTYAARAAARELHLVPQVDPIQTISGEEMVTIYDYRMVGKKQPGRPIYDRLKLLPKHDICPFCGHRNISTLDHVLPKKRYPIFAVTPLNLVASCADCNKAKLSVVPTTAANAVLHPYFDTVDDRQWLFAVVIEQSPAAVLFSVGNVPEWDVAVNARVLNQFSLLGLATLYSSQAAREIADIRHNLQRHFDGGGSDAVRNELLFQWRSRHENHINSWQAAAYGAFYHSLWFCGGGFALP